MLEELGNDRGGKWGELCGEGESVEVVDAFDSYLSGGVRLRFIRR